MPFFDPTHPITSHQRNLPHWQQGECAVFATWSLIDSLPKDTTRKLKARRDHWLASRPKPWDEKTEKEYYVLFANPINEMLDRGYGECILHDAALAKIVADHLLAKKGDLYILHSFVIMPNHVHTLFSPAEGASMEKILQSWKGASARELNQHRDSSGSVWQQEYWDRLIRSRVHFDYVIGYIRNGGLNHPVVATVDGDLGTGGGGEDLAGDGADSFGDF